MLQYEHPEIETSSGTGIDEIGDTTLDITSWARERAEMLQGLYIHLIVYVVVNAGLFGINWLTRSQGGTWWFIWPIVGWGIGLLVHLVTVAFPVFSDRWVQTKAEELRMRRM